MANAANSLQGLASGILKPQMNFSVAHDFDGLSGGDLTFRADLINALDEKYQIRDGSGVGAPEYGPRRRVFVGVTNAF